MTDLSQDDRVKKVYQRKVKKCFQNTFSISVLKKRLPIIEWLPNYRFDYFIQDVIAGITVALTAIPQGIAYAVIAGLPPEYGLYASLTAGLVYVIFGSCPYVTVGPTAIMASMTARYVADYSADFAIIVTFLSGIVIFLMGLMNIGCLVEFISMPVISGFTTAAAFQIASSQLKPFLGLEGPGGNTFMQSWQNFFTNITTAKLWETVLCSSTVLLLLFLKKIGQGCKRTDGFVKRTRWFLSLSKNAVVVIIGMIIAYVLKITLNSEPLVLIGNIGGGLPKFSLPPFGTVIGNETYSFVDMMKILGPQSIVIPFVAILETVAIAKAFAEGGRIDASQEMIAIGLCNIMGSFGQSMPIAGSFTRTALNFQSGVKTAAGGVTNVLILSVALTYLTSAFYYIPKASLAGLIVTAMLTMIDYQMMISLWRSSIRGLAIFVITVLICLFAGLEYGIIAGIVIEASMLLYTVARPAIEVETLKYEKGHMLVIYLSEIVSYCSAEHVRKRVMRATYDDANIPIIIDGGKLKKLDYTSTVQLMSILHELDKTHNVMLFNFNLDMKNLCLNIDSRFETKFVYASSRQELVDVFPKDV